MLKIWKKKSWEPFGSCLLNSRANSHHFHLNWDGLAVLFSRQLQNDFFFHIFSIIFLSYLIKNPQTTIAFTFLTHNISDIGGVTHQHKEKTCYNTNANNLQKCHIQRWQDFSMIFRFRHTIWTVKSAISGSKRTELAAGFILQIWHFWQSKLYV